MTSLSSAIQRLQTEQFWKLSSALLTVAFAFGLAVILLSTWLSTTALIVLCLLLVGGLAFSFLARDEVALLCGILVAFVVVVRYEEGFQPEEVVYGLLYMGYLAYWFISRSFFYRDSYLRTKLDWALFLFLVYATLSLALTPLFDGDMRAAISQWLSITMLAFYFPIKEVCIRHSERVPEKKILLSIGFVALFVSIRNLLDYKTGLGQAEYLWQIASGRVVMNEHLLMMAGLITLLFFLHTQGWFRRVLFGGLFLLFSMGVLIGQSRAVWVSFLLGIAIIFLFVDKRKRIVIAALGFGSLAAVLLVGAVVLENFFTLIIAGLTNRFFSLQTAATADISFINRFVEMAAAWEHIKINPIIGHGFGVPFGYYSLVYELTWVRSYVHNQYVGVLYKHGLIGFSLLFGFYFGIIWVAFRTARQAGVLRLDRIIAIGAVACLLAENLVGNMANPFATADTTLLIAAIAGLTAGVSHRVERGVGRP